MTYPSTGRRFDGTPDGDLAAAREQATAVLTDRYADESLTEAEFEARLYWLGQADTASRVRELVADLHQPLPRTAGRLGGYGPGRVAGLPPGEQRLFAMMSSTTRSGHWTMPPRLVARAVMSELVLDLRYAALPPVAEVDLFTLMANVRIIVPPEIEVECLVSPVMGTVKNETGHARWAGVARPRVRVTGTCLMAELVIEIAPRQAGW